MAWNRIHWSIRMLKSKTGRMIIMLILTVAIAVAEIVYGIRTRSQLLIADGLFSCAEGIALVGSLLALRYAKAVHLHERNTFGWARLELLAGLLQEVLLISLSLSIVIDAINKIINPNHIEEPTVMIYLGSAGVCVGLLGIFLFRSYHHDHNIRHEIVEQRKIDFVESVYNTLRNINIDPEDKLITTEFENSSNLNQQRKTEPNLISPSLNDASTNAFTAADPAEKVPSSPNGQQLRVPERLSIQSRLRNRGSVVSAMTNFNDEKSVYDDEFQESRVYATLHALCLHSLAVLLESSVVLFTGLLNKYVPQTDKATGEVINSWLKYIDPSLTLVMVVIITIKAVPVIWSLGHILVEAVPAGINTRQLIQTIMRTIPQIRAVHAVHVWRATARDVYATLHVVCDEDLPLSTCTNIFGRQLERIFEAHCIRHYTIQYEYAQWRENINRCAYGGTRRRHRGHQSSSDDVENEIQLQIDSPGQSLKINHIIQNPIEECV